MKLGIASDHRGYHLKEKIREAIEDIEIVDFGTESEESCDYPDYAFKLGEAVAKKEVDYGIAICGSGIGISIACNKVKGIRCAKVSNIEDARVTRIDNNSNIVAFKEDVPIDEALNIIYTFINTEFSKEEKHHRRVDKIIKYEEEHYDR